MPLKKIDLREASSSPSFDANIIITNNEFRKQKLLMNL